MPPIDTTIGVSETGSADGFDATNAFLNMWKEDGESPSDPAVSERPKKKAPTEKAPSEDVKEPEEVEEPSEAVEGDDDTDAPEEAPETDEKKPAAKRAADTDEVEITVDGEARVVPIKDLKRLFGQEAALTRKSQEVAEVRKEAEAKEQRHNAALERLTAAAEERWKPYSQLDFLVLSRQMDPEAFKALRADAKEAYDHFNFVKSELDQHIQATTQERTKATQVQAKETIKVLTEKVPGWNEKMYNDIIGYVTSQGMPEGMARNIMDPSAIIIMNKARLYDAAQKKTSEAVTKVVNSAPKTVVKPGTSSPPVSNPQKNAALARLAKTGKQEDAQKAFMAMFRRSDD